MKFPYGMSDFKKMITQNFYYCDRTDWIPLLENGAYLLFLRPRRFGKSLLLSMLANYYDVALQDRFERIFGHLNIGQNPTPLHNRYFIMHWDFSCVDPSGDANEIKKALHGHINSRINKFRVKYASYLDIPIEIDPDNTINSIEAVVTSTQMTDYPIYLLIDEYDNFANEVMTGMRQDTQSRYEALVFGEGPLKTLFKAIKASTSDSLFDRIFITGVSPVVMSDITSGYNIGENIYTDESYNDLCGFTEAEIKAVLNDLGDHDH